MKKILSVFAFLAVGVFAAGCSMSSVDPVTYNNNIVDVMDAIDAAYNDYSVYAEETSLTYVDKIEAKRVEMLAVIQGNIAKFDAMGGYRDDTALIDAARKYSQATVSLMETEEKELLALWTKLAADDTMTEEDFQAQQDVIIKKINAIIETTNTEFETIQTAFAAKHGYELVE